MDRSCLVCGFVALLSVVSLTQSSSITGIITPTTPSAFTGNRRNIVLNCTLQGNITNERSAQNVSFAFTNDDVQSKALTQVIDDRTVKLTIVGVYVNMSSSRIACLLGNDTLDEVSIVVDDPRFPNHSECIVYNWESMTCTWDVEDTANVSVSMAYSRNNCANSRWECPYPMLERGGRGGCNWLSYSAGSGTHDPFQLAKHCVYFKAKNAYNAVAYGVGRPVNVYVIVKPNKVSLQSDNATSYNIELRWAAVTSESLRRPINYRVMYKSRFSTTAVQNTSGTSMMLSNLIPNTNYTISIDCIPLLKKQQSLVATGIWSDRETMHVKTNSTVPGDSPSVTSGGYLVSERIATHRMIKLFFQPVADILSHGEIKGYRVRYSVGNSTNQSELPGVMTSVDLSLEMEKSYVVSVEMKNVKGYNESLALKTIVIGRQSEVPPFPENFVVQTDGNDYILTWTEVDNATSYTVYSCSSNIRTFECKSELKWKVVQGNQTSEVLHVVADAGLLLRFALSVERVDHATGETVSSGLFVANCTYSTKGELKPPQGVKVMRSTASTIIVDFMRPDRTASSDNNCNGIAYAAQYFITYCPSGYCSDTDKIFNLAVESFHDSVTIDGLDADQTYEIKIWSVSESGNTSATPFSHSVMKYTDKPPEEPSSTTVFVVLGVAIALVVLSALIFGVVKCVGWAKKKLHIEVKTPQKYLNSNPTSPTTETSTVYSTFLRTDLTSNGQIQTTVWESSHHHKRPTHGYFNAGSIQPNEDENLLSRHNSEHKSSSTSTSSEMSSMPSATQSNSVSSNSSSDPRRDSGISAVSISGYNVVIERPSDTSASFSSSGGFPRIILPSDESAIATTEIV